MRLDSDARMTAVVRPGDASAARSVVLSDMSVRSLLRACADAPVPSYLQAMDVLFVEIRAAEGGDDAKSLVALQYRTYQKFMALERL